MGHRYWKFPRPFQGEGEREGDIKKERESERKMEVWNERGKLREVLRC
jgi:hypothetical protein